MSERAYCCTACGMVADRDLNAALNLAALGRRELAGSGPDSNGRGAGRKSGPARRAAVKRQPGTGQPGQAGTAAPQGTAAA
ncbi:MAG TPA: zinc ribbon domain-containing protein [Trebonia sp.]